MSAAVPHPSPRGPSSGRPSSRRLVVGGVAVGLFVLLAAVASGGPQGPRGDGPPSSSFTVRPEGAAGYARLLERLGHPVEALGGELVAGRLPPDATVVVVDAGDLLTDEEVRALTDFVEAGGRLVGAGSDEEWLRTLVPGLRTGPDGPPRARSTAAGAAELGLPLTVETAGEGSFTALGGAEALIGEGSAVVVAQARRGRGRILAVADSSLLHNRLLTRADNAAAVLALAGEEGRPVRFAEGHHGFGGEAPGGLPVAWVRAWLVLLLAGAAFALARGRRLGPPEEAGRDLPPPRLAYVDSLAATLLRCRRLGESVAPVQARCRRLLSASLTLPADAPDEELRAAATRVGLTGEEVEAVLGPIGDTAAALAAGRALARLESGGGRW